MPEILIKGFDKYLLVNLRISKEDISSISEFKSFSEIGEILSIKSPDTVEVKFRRGSFLIDIDNIEKN